PQTGEEMAIPASKVPAFKPGKELKEAIKSL
ncbi:HU family DNA-binding protein, partial [Priestia megaterium]